ncbi:unnamed protein product [Ectocarpus sp. 6 AP-2014]
MSTSLVPNGSLRDDFSTCVRLRRRRSVANPVSVLSSFFTRNATLRFAIFLFLFLAAAAAAILILLLRRLDAAAALSVRHAPGDSPAAVRLVIAAVIFIIIAAGFFP